MNWSKKEVCTKSEAQKQHQKRDTNQGKVRKKKHK